ncbi:MAG: valine--tRNA ligase [Elusimicrobiota bacterium]|jgi:valyl-tRNA synthetase|nr:valine--tRNA ligase [Elusimicrobiota bacterium]
MEKTYSPKEVEEKWSKFWIANKTFSARIDKNKKPFSIVIPPPNVTGVLHMGHALNNTLQDIIIRFKKMQGFNTLWVPGTDHGGIATQNVVEKLLKKEGKTKNSLGREKFLETMRQWRQETGDSILEQLKKLGCALDWDRTAFTMDESRSRAVRKAFVKLFEKNLIYRGKRLVNWCCNCGTALSDSEVEYESESSNLWHIKYPFTDGNGYITIATTRPETMLGDTAIAVNPRDERYIDLIGKTVLLPLTDRKIKIIADFAVDKSFGTGALKVTPAHDSADDAIAQRNNLQYIEVINTEGKIFNSPEKYNGLKVLEARKIIVEDLEKNGFLLETENYQHSVGRCYRCSSTIEPLMSSQWFLNVSEMSKRTAQAAENNETQFFPPSWKRPYTLWLENIKDWCISRQIWWGHRLPIYYCQKGCPPFASLEEPSKCPHCGGMDIKQDEDVLDTWFSSALWPISVFNWGIDEENEDLKYFYPTSTLATGHEILYLWVARMVQFGFEFMQDVPYKHIFIHGIVRDKHGKKMSKTLGNVVDPLLMIEKFGADALRFALAQSAAPGRDMQISEDSFLSARNFANKIWNASRFIIMNMEGLDKIDEDIKPVEMADEWILAEFEKTSRKIKSLYESYDIDGAARENYDFFWNKFCDWYIEISKARAASSDAKTKRQVLSILIYILKGSLQLLHPIMPFISSEIWQALDGALKNKSGEIISKTSFIENVKIKNADEVLGKMLSIQNIIAAIRALRSEINIPLASNINVVFNVLDEKKRNAASESESYIKRLAKIEKIEYAKDIKRPKNCAVALTEGFEIFVPLEGLIDIDKEKARLQKEREKISLELQRTESKLKDENFISKAPEAEIEKIKERLFQARLKVNKIDENLAYISE